ncbi:acylneuraminate cytidylyltransferase family protein [Gammaproteobacteria bacterium]|nr:acylneuraminate cytidylyltransferase family protein [Gammaproteobacteria bacterium]MDB9841952.1 acylneuraminate cytidylyltransferase family protein [Gammaproteobacteria bacterium]
MDDIIAIIPARSGSKSLVDKNIRELSGHPLIAYSIAAAKLSKKINRVFVSTNSKKYERIAKKYGAEVPFIRPNQFSTDDSTDKDFLVHAMSWIQENEGKAPEHWVHLRPTTPLRDIALIDNAIDKITKNKNATSLRSGHKAPESPLKWFIHDGLYFKGLVNGEDYNLPKEAFEQVYIPDGFIDIVKLSFVMNNTEIHGDKMIGFESPVCYEVDSLEEFDYIQYQLDQNGSLLLNYLNKVKG